jgi:hypothetical protein
VPTVAPAPSESLHPNAAISEAPIQKEAQRRFKDVRKVCMAVLVGGEKRSLEQNQIE